MMQTGVCLIRDTETTLPELTEQHRVRLKEEELSALESVHMAESETECAAPGLNTLEPECVIAHSGISGVHHTCASLIKTETDLGSTHTADLIKTESLDSTEVGYPTSLHPDQLKTETDDGDYIKAEHISHLQDIKSVDIKSEKIKCESSEILVSNVTNTVMNGAGVDHKDQIEPWQCAGEPNPNCKKEDPDLSTQCRDLNHYYGVNNENNETRIVKKNTKSGNKHLNCQRSNMMIQSMINNSSKNPCTYSKTQIMHRNEGEMNTGDNTKSDLGENLHKCIHCEKCFNTKFDLTEHLRIHIGEKPYKCTHCETCFYAKSHLKVHLRIHTGEKPHKCTHCEKCFSSKSYLTVHLRIHTGERPYKCTQCEASFYTNSHLYVHLRIHTGEKPYKCTQCEKCFNTKSDLKVHNLRIHTSERPYKCTQCEKCFITKSELKIHHFRIHNEKPYKCTQCEKCFNTKNILTRRLLIHTGEKVHKCTQCEKCFNAKYILTRHLRIHTREKQYKCTHCEKCFNAKSDLKIHHFRIHTREKAYKCTHCEKCFNIKSDLKKHHLRVHTSEKP